MEVLWIWKWKSLRKRISKLRKLKSKSHFLVKRLVLFEKFSHPLHWNLEIRLWLRYKTKIFRCTKIHLLNALNWWYQLNQTRAAQKAISSANSRLTKVCSKFSECFATFESKDLRCSRRKTWWTVWPSGMLHQSLMIKQLEAPKLQSSNAKAFSRPSI